MQLFSNILGRFGIDTTFVSPTDPAACAAVAMFRMAYENPRTRLATGREALDEPTFVGVTVGILPRNPSGKLGP